MRSLSLLVLLGCGPSGDPLEVPDESGCSVVLDPVRGTERSWLGVSPNGVRVLAGQPQRGTWGDDRPVEIAVEWTGGLSAWVFATPQGEPPSPAPPLWCEDRLEIPGSLQLGVEGEPAVVVSGAVRAAGPVDGLQVHFVGEVPGVDWPAAVPSGQDPEATSLVVWARLGDAGPSGEVRVSGDPVGEVTARWAP